MDGPVLLAHSYFLRFDPKQAQKMRPYPPLATLYVAANLRAQGFDVAVFDAMLSEGEHRFAEMVDEIRPAVVVLYEDNFNFLSKMCLTRMREAALTMAGAARHVGAAVIASGSDVSDRPELYLDAGVHFCVIGEGDHTVSELVHWLDGGAVAGRDLPEGIDGVVCRDGGRAEAKGTPSRSNERHPGVFPHPARDLVDIDAYRRAWQQAHGHFSLNMVSTRGCPFHCNWCAKPIWGQRYAMRPPEDVAAELAAVKRDHAPDHIWFADDIFGLRPSWVIEFAREVERLDAHIPFSMQSRCDLMSPETVEALRRAGCAQVWLGAESGSQRILDAMDKGTTVEDIRTARARLGSAGIRAAFFVQFGYPGETWDDIATTIALVRETLPDDLGVSVSYPLPGTRFHEMVRDELEDKTNWDVSGDLAMMFRGTYTTPFYRQLHLALHDDLDLHRRKADLDPVPHAQLPEVERDDQEARVALAWAELAQLERSCRNRRPTILVRSEPAPEPPDLSLPFN
ncbi:MAG: B12-binding domain-containing radical SAM protein [Acidimicrobiia bacterium]|nr:B12-binding domain-containing radical SAM protein [Acidimicrobiia bacterium]